MIEPGEKVSFKHNGERVYAVTHVPITDTDGDLIFWEVIGWDTSKCEDKIWHIAPEDLRSEE